MVKVRYRVSGFSS